MSSNRIYRDLDKPVRSYEAEELYPIGYDEPTEYVYVYTKIGDDYVETLTKRKDMGEIEDKVIGVYPAPKCVDAAIWLANL